MLEKFWLALSPVFLMVAAILAPVALWLVAQAPVEVLQGPPQKIFYLHVNLAWIAFILAGGVAVCGFIYLIRKNIFWDQAAHGLANVALLYMTGVMLTGPVWAKPIWNVWWVWEPRLTTFFILWVLYLVYHLITWLRGTDAKAAGIKAIIAIFAFADVPIVHLSVKWWRTLHPDPVVFKKGNVGGGLDPQMYLPLIFMALFLFFLAFGLASLRSRMRKLEDHLILEVT